MTREEEIKFQSKKRHFEKYNCEGFCPDFEDGAKWADKMMIEKACEWLEKNVWPMTGVDHSALTESFKKAMEE